MNGPPAIPTAADKELARARERVGNGPRPEGVAWGHVRVLVIEDDPRLLEILTRHLDRMGYAVRGACGGREGLEGFDDDPPDIVLSDIRMPGMDGHTLLQEVRVRRPETKVVLMTAFGSVDDAVAAMRAGAYSYICKPFRVDEAAAVLGNAAREISLAREVGHLRKAVRGRFSADRLIGPSARMREVRRVIRDAAAVTATVLVTGRSGTGKEMAARAIHFEGPRAAGPFIPVNCAAIPETLFESEMFGHTRGAFTGADRRQMGLIEQSSGGTLFLDEVSEIPPAQQAKLLRVLQERELRPVGGGPVAKLDLRVICASNRDLEAMVRAGDLREDLYYRVNVLHVHLPDLATRVEDIPPLADHLLLEIAQDNGLPSPGFTEEALRALERHAWPGNVRELRNVVERALLATRGRRIDQRDLGIGTVAAAPIEAAAQAEAGQAEPARDMTLAALEKAHVERVLRLCDWNRSAAARMLGIDRRTLFSKVQRHGLVGPLRAGPRGEDGAE